MTNREMDTLISCINHAFSVLGKPDNINCDNEFNKTEINEMANDLGIKMWYSHPEEINKNAIVERCNRTISEMIQKSRIVNGGMYKWYKELDKIVDNYNHQYHKTIKATPFDIFNQRAINKQNITKITPVHKIGDTVRIRLVKNVFDKGDRLKYTEKAYKIKEQRGEKYILEHAGDKAYKPYELMKTNAQPYKPSARIHIIRPKIEPVKRNYGAIVRKPEERRKRVIMEAV
jgi:hypothetical protein